MARRLDRHPMLRVIVYDTMRLLAVPIAPDLALLAGFYGTDKQRAAHDYARLYATHLPDRRGVRSVLEIGVGGDINPTSGGKSLQMWRSYFPRAQIYGVDIYEKDLPLGKRIEVVQADQGDVARMKELAARWGPFDLVVDDGSHLGVDQRASFSALFPSVRPGGLYVIEDLETAYWENWQGGPRGTPGTSLDLIRDLVDDVQIGPHPVAGLFVYPGIVFIERAQSAHAMAPQLPRFTPSGLV